jgi:xylitol oxidase
VPGLTNWAGNLVYSAARLHEPESMEHLQEIVRNASSLRVLGSRHSFNDIADTTGDLLSLRRMPRVFELDPDARTVTVDGGVRYGELCDILDRAGFALHNLASLPHISVAGACATGTHGSGDRSGNLATAVSAMQVVRADGELVNFARGDGNVFEGAVVSLGGLGAVTRLSLDLLPTFQMRQDLYEGLPLARVADHFDEITASADSVSLFTHWQAPTFEQVWLKRRVPEGDTFTPPAELYGAVAATVPMHPLPWLSADACTEQMGIAGPWHERLPHFRMDHTPSAGAELQTEYLVARQHGVQALMAVHALRHRFAQILQISEIRTVAADDMWMSPSCQRASVAIHFTWVPDWDGVRRVLPSIEEALAPFEARPHWGKLFTIPHEDLRSRYPMLPRFADLLRRHDPEGTFSKAFLERNIFGRS